MRIRSPLQPRPFPDDLPGFVHRAMGSRVLDFDGKGLGCFLGLIGFVRLGSRVLVSHWGKQRRQCMLGP